jgi:hypothetical protein
VTVPRRRADLLRLPELRIGAIVALAVALGVVIWIAARDDGGSSSPSPPAPATAPQPEPEARSVDELRALAASVGHPVYWTGPRQGFTYEVTHTADGRIYVRYLPEGVEVGDRRPSFTTVGTYPVADAFQATQRVSRQRGATSRRLQDGTIVVRGSARATSVYLAAPGSDFQVEVYDPSPQRAFQVATSGQVVPVR